MRILLVIFLIFFSGSFYAQYLSTDWGALFKTKSFPFGLSHSGKGISVTSDDNGNIYVASVFKDTVTLVGVSDSITVISAGNNDGVVAKFNSSGACLWAHNIGGTGQDFCNIIKVVSDGSVIIGGGYSNQVDFDSSVNDSICTAYNPYDVFFLKLTSNGDFQWVRTLAGSSSTYDCIHALKENSNHELVLAGEFSGQIDFDPGANNHYLTGLGSFFFQYKDAFLATYDSNGNFIWANQIGGNGPYDKAFDLDLDGNDNILVTGYFGSPKMDMDPSVNSSVIYNTDTLNPYTDIFLAKYDVNGNHLWSGSFGGPSSDYGNTVDVAPNGEIVICGDVSGNIDFDITSGTHFVNINDGFTTYIAKYSSSGALSWVRRAKKITILDAAISSEGTVFLTGVVMDTAFFDGQMRISNGVIDYFVAELGSNGNLMWMNSFGGPSEDGLQCISLVSENEIVVGGTFKFLTDIDPSSANYEFVGESTNANFLLAKYSLGDLGLEQLIDQPITIYPNPNNGTYLNVALTQPFDLIELVDLYGKKILQSNAAQIDVSSLENGEYLVRVYYSNQPIETYKFIVCR